MTFWKVLMLSPNNNFFDEGVSPRQTALRFAAREGREAAVAELIRRHADVSQRTAHGILPIELASGGCALLIRQEACRRIKVGKMMENACRMGHGIFAVHVPSGGLVIKHGWPQSPPLSSMIAMDLHG